MISSNGIKCVEQHMVLKNAYVNGFVKCVEQHIALKNAYVNGLR